MPGRDELRLRLGNRCECPLVMLLHQPMPAHEEILQERHIEPLAAAPNRIGPAEPLGTTYPMPVAPPDMRTAMHPGTKFGVPDAAAPAVVAAAHGFAYAAIPPTEVIGSLVVRCCDIVSPSFKPSGRIENPPCLTRKVRDGHSHLLFGIDSRIAI